MLVTGFFLALAGRSARLNLELRRIEEAVETLRGQQRSHSRQALLASAVELLYLAYESEGPSMVGAYDIAEMRSRLEDVLPLVVDVELGLLGHGLIRPTFTLGQADEEPGQAAGEGR